MRFLLAWVAGVIAASACLAADAPATAPAAGAPRRPAPPAVAPLRPFTAFSWSFAGPRPHVKPVYWLGVNTVPGVAALATKRMDDGARVVLTTDYTPPLLRHPNDVCLTRDGEPTAVPGVWPEHGPREIARHFDAFLTAFAAAGGRIDFLALDREEGFSTWVMSEAAVDAIRQDPRSAALADRLGFEDFRLGLFKFRTEKQEYLQWNAVMNRVVEDATDRAMLEPLRRHFPRAGMSNFDGVAMDKAEVTPEANGHLQYRIGEPTGTHQSPVVYGAAFPKAAVEADWNRPFMQVVFAANLVRACARSSPRPIVPWVAYKSFWRADAGGRTTVWGNTEWWDEGVYHALLGGGTDNLLFWNPITPKRTPFDPPPPNSSTPADADAIEAVLADFERQARGQRPVATAIPERVAWDAGFVLSAARLTDGSALGRVTFAEDVEQAVFRWGDRTMTVDRPAGRRGAWVRLP